MNKQNKKFRFNLIPIALASFRKAFALQCEDKGEFPFLLIEPSNYHTVRKGLPRRRYYNVNGKSVEKKQDFLAWYNSHSSSYEFDFDRELREYCRQDVIILLLGLIEYRLAMIELTKWDPIPHVPTLASFTAHILRCDHIPKKTLCNLPENGYNPNRQQSE